MHVNEFGEVVDEHSGANILLFGRFASVCGDKAQSRANQLVDADNLSWGGTFDLFSVSGAFVTPGAAMGLAVGAAGTLWRFDICKFWRDEASVGHEFECCKARVSESLVNRIEAVLFSLVVRNFGCLLFAFCW